MIIYIDKSIKDYGSSHKLSGKELDLFENLATAHRNGDCMLCGHNDSIRWIMSIMHERARYEYDRIYRNFPQIKSLIEHVDTLIVISQELHPLLPDFFPKNYFTLSLSAASSFRFDQRCSLICENLSDCAFYTLIAKRYCRDKAINGIQLSFRNDLGGGGTMYQVYQERIINDKVPTICLVDSDYKFLRNGSLPKLGSTADKMKSTNRELHRQVKPSIFNVYCIKAHEAENLIPISILNEVISTVSDISNGVLYLKKLIDSGHTQAVLLYDFKHGDTELKDPKVLSDPKKAAKRADALSYWNSIGEDIGDTNMPPLCTDILEHSIKVLQDTEHYAVHYENVPIDDYLAPSWNEIGLMLLSWGCANKRTST